MKHAACRVLLDHPVHGPGPYYAICGEYFPADREDLVAKEYKDLDCTACKEEMERQAEVVRRIVAKKK